MHTITKEHLLEAMKGEAFAFAKYMLFARDARAEGHEEIAALFEKTAQEEGHEHFRELAILYGLSGTTEENLKNAIQGETEEVEHTYVRFRKASRAAGDTAVADRFEEIRHDERIHDARFRQAQSKLRVAQPHMAEHHPSSNGSDVPGGPFDY
jgi:rubrerythrin